VLGWQMAGDNIGSVSVIKYFKDLLKTLQNIERYLSSINDCITDSNWRKNKSIRTQHWNDGT
jgi:hypothetical protein